MKKYFTFISTGILMIFIGSVYKFSFEVIEQEAKEMGLLAILIGVVSILLSPLYGNKYLKYFAILGYGLIALVQLVPISLWFIMAPITDTPGVYQGNIFFAIPHIILFVFSIWCIFSLFRKQ